ncbi:lipocalin family protein [Xanthomonas sp. NCPPB 2632]|jgi:apolipoprotein D and lipocalin family protein|uniref:lipocalin family protein n=1 Tax=Xanthomonas sp. NCPPB 2632 TaxID=3240912 RepID=UPI003515822E
MRIALTALLLSMATTGALASTPVTAVSHLDLDRYAGTWHEIARLPMWFQRKCEKDVTAHYTPQPDGTVAVHNACVTAEGKTIASDGVARRPEPFALGKLQVRFAPAWLSWVPLVWADYWVVALDDDYRWAMIGQPGRKYLWILSREPSLDRKTFEELKARAVSMGYDLGPLIVSGKVD